MDRPPHCPRAVSPHPTLPHFSVLILCPNPGLYMVQSLQVVSSLTHGHPLLSPAGKAAGYSFAEWPRLASNPPAPLPHPLTQAPRLLLTLPAPPRYGLMRSAGMQHPLKRPTFKQLVEALDKVLLAVSEEVLRPYGPKTVPHPHAHCLWASSHLTTRADQPCSPQYLDLRPSLWTLLPCRRGRQQHLLLSRLCLQPRPPTTEGPAPSPSLGAGVSRGTGCTGRVSCKPWALLAQLQPGGARPWQPQALT